MDVVISKDIPVEYKAKELHKKNMKSKATYSFGIFYGDIPVFIIRGRDIVLVQNFRGKAYAARKRQKYRKGYKRNKIID